MHLRSVSLSNFKNYEECQLILSSGINLISGDNGAGKTNLLDAIHYLCISKSAFSSIDTLAIKHEAQYFSVIGEIEDDTSTYRVICGIKGGDKKVLTVNGQAYPKISEHIGRFPCVLIAPDQIALVKEGSDERRKFFDNVISQVDSEYLEQLMRYNKYLKARNQLLKQFYERNYRDALLLESYSEPLVKSGLFIYETRKVFLEKFKPVLQEVYYMISSFKEQIDVVYESQLNEGNFAELNSKSIQDDYRSQRTTVGTHLDDFSLLINGNSLKKFGSQGQQKTFLLALKIAQHKIISQILGKKPIMLLDDIFDKLDDKRIAQLLDMCKSGYFGQVFITDARKDRTEKLLKHAHIKATVFEINDGQVKDET